MSESVNDNENVFRKNSISINNDNVIEPKYVRSRKVEMLADRLVEIFNNVEYRQFYCKVAWKLSEARIWSNVEDANKGKDPARLFTYLCKRDGV